MQQTLLTDAETDHSTDFSGHVKQCLMFVFWLQGWKKMLKSTQRGKIEKKNVLLH